MFFLLMLVVVHSWELSDECHEILSDYCGENDTNKEPPYVFGTDCFLFHYYLGFIQMECDNDYQAFLDLYTFDNSTLCKNITDMCEDGDSHCYGRKYANCLYGRVPICEFFNMTEYYYCCNTTDECLHTVPRYFDSGTIILDISSIWGILGISILSIVIFAIISIIVLITYRRSQTSPLYQRVA